jgi:hypothetical protein
MAESLTTLWSDHGDLIKTLAADLGCDPAAALAVFSVESGGRFFGDDGRPMIRFENHVFWGYWGKNHPDEFDARFCPRQGCRDHKFRLDAAGPFLDFHGSQTKEWSVLGFARTLDEEAALKSASYGAPQIMGFNHQALGYGSAKELVDAFAASADNQIQGFFAFVRTNNLARHLIAGDFRSFARGYNGAGNVDAYAGLIDHAYAAAKNLTA